MQIRLCSQHVPALCDDLEPIFHTNPLKRNFCLAFNSNPDRAAARWLDNQTKSKRHKLENKNMHTWYCSSLSIHDSHTSYIYTEIIMHTLITASSTTVFLNLLLLFSFFLVHVCILVVSINHLIVNKCGMQSMWHIVWNFHYNKWFQSHCACIVNDCM